MKMLFFSSERGEIEEVRKGFMDAGIPCEIHENQNGEEASPPKSPDTEIWIQNDGDSYRALLLCVKLGVGFARRALSSEGEESNGNA